MDIKDVLILTFMLLAVGFSLYRKYIKKDQEKSTGRQKSGSGSLHQKDDDYEPYSGK